eukprot:gene3165-5481_t
MSDQIPFYDLSEVLRSPDCNKILRFKKETIKAIEEFKRIQQENEFLLKKIEELQQNKNDNDQKNITNQTPTFGDLFEILRSPDRKMILHSRKETIKAKEALKRAQQEKILLLIKIEQIQHKNDTDISTMDSLVFLKCESVRCESEKSHQTANEKDKNTQKLAKKNKQQENDSKDHSKSNNQIDPNSANYLFIGSLLTVLLLIGLLDFF